MVAQADALALQGEAVVPVVEAAEGAHADQHKCRHDGVQDPEHRRVVQYVVDAEEEEELDEIEPIHLEARYRVAAAQPQATPPRGRRLHRHGMAAKAELAEAASLSLDRVAVGGGQAEA